MSDLENGLREFSYAIKFGFGHLFETVTHKATGKIVYAQTFPAQYLGDECITIYARGMFMSFLRSHEMGDLPLPNRLECAKNNDASENYIELFGSNDQ